MSAKYKEMSKAQLQQKLDELFVIYNDCKSEKCHLDMTRGKPCAEQLDLSERIFNLPKTNEDCIFENIDTRNYGGLEGLPAARRLFGQIIDIPAENIMVGGNSSLSLMYDAVARAFSFGFHNSPMPWAKEQKVKFLCPAPGYDRHFSICELFGIEMILINMLEDGPDMDEIERLVSADSAIKGIFCVPRFSNPTGIVYSDTVVKRFAALKPKAADFKIFWDNAYAVHELYENSDKLLNLFDECTKMDSLDMLLVFSSMSKITFAGASISMLAASDQNLNTIKSQLSIQTIGFDKLTQLRHVLMFKNVEDVYAHMKKHGEILRPKFEMVIKVLKQELDGLDCGSWSDPKGGYFIEFNSVDGCAARIYNLCEQIGVILTKVGATFPYGKDPNDKNIRLAPSFPSVEELYEAITRFAVCVKIATVEKLLNS